MVCLLTSYPAFSASFNCKCIPVFKPTHRQSFSSFAQNELFDRKERPRTPGHHRIPAQVITEYVM